MSPRLLSIASSSDLYNHEWKCQVTLLEDSTLMTKTEQNNLAQTSPSVNKIQVIIRWFLVKTRIKSLIYFISDS